MAKAITQPALSSKTSSRTAIKKVSNLSVSSNPNSTQKSNNEVSKLSTLRPGAIIEEEENKKNTEDTKVARSESNQVRSFVDIREQRNRDFVNRLWGNTSGVSAISKAPLSGASGSGSIAIASPSLDSSGVPSIGDLGSSSSTSPKTSSKTASANSDNSSSRTYIDKEGRLHQISDPNGNLTDEQIRKNPEGFSNNPQDHYQQVQRIEPDQKPTGTKEALEDYKAKMQGNDKAIFERLENLVRVYDDDRVGFGTNLSNIEKGPELSNNNKLKTQAIASLVDALKNDPNKETYLSNLKNVGGMDIFLSDKLSFGLNKSVGGFVSSPEDFSGRYQMALPKDLTNYTHADIARHEMYHLLDSLADGKLDGMQAGEGREMQDKLIAAMQGFNSSKYDADKIEKLDITNLRYGAGYLKTLNDSDPKNDLYAYTEANSVLRQEWADKPEEFRAVGGEFAELADMFEKNGTKYENSYVKKDGDEDGTSML